MNLPGGATWGVWLVIGVIAAVFVCVNVATATWVLPWTDEVMQIDAGVNLYLGNGWASTAWQSQSAQEFWAANNPLFALYIFAWVSVFGFSLVTVRSANLALALLITWLLVDTARRARLVESKFGLLFMALLLLCSDPLAFVYRSGRADLITMLVMTLVFRVYALARPGVKRVVGLLACSIPLAAAGLHAIPYLCLLLLIVRVVTGKIAATDLLAMGVGSGLGGLMLMAVFLSQHALGAYLAQTVASGYNILGAALQAAKFHDPASVGRFVDVLRALAPDRVIETVFHDWGSGLMIIAMAVGFVALHRVKHSGARFAARVGLITAIVIPYGMLAAGRYAYYYSWMGAAPVALLYTRFVEACRTEGRTSLAAIGVFCGIAALVVGLPLRLWREVPSITAMRYSDLDAAFRREVRVDDVVYADPIFYYAAKQARLPFYSLTYAGGRGYRQMSVQERARISVAIVAQVDVPQTVEKLGGEWRRGDVIDLASHSSPMVVLRRRPQAE